ncbi:NAD(P)H-binding protein [Kitasatospora sp. NPDC058965]|uniref:NAD(P)H-binding protein n=1 Tax=Kitasatospora sp. NPDC058965 TaxID=3346682 RepID=UPI0036905A51
MIVVTGATGTVGSRIVRGLRERGEQVRTPVRNPGAVPAEWDAGVTPVAADFTDPASLDAALAGATVVYLLAGVDPQMAQHERNVIDAAVRAGSHPRIVLQAASGVDGPHEGVRFLTAHAQAWAHLRASGLPWTVLAPNGFYQNFLLMAGSVRAGQLSVPGGGAAVSYVDADDVAACAVEVLTGAGHEGALYTLTGPAGLTHGEIAEQLGAAAGHEVAYVAAEPQAALAYMLGAGWDPWRAEGLVELYGYYAAGSAAGVSPDVAGLTGRGPRPLADFLAVNGGVLRGE